VNVEFWFDPICPFCWMTSRWINRVAPERDLAIEWRPISLLFKNGMDADHPFHAKASRTRNLLRVVESVRAAGHADRIGELYTAFGTCIHLRGETEFDVAEVLTEVGLDPVHAGALDDESFDDTIRAAMADGLSLTGNDVGTPIIAIEGRAGRAGVFGPVITKLPALDDALRLWDGFVALVETDGFFELKRTRTAGPDMSTIPSG